MSQLGFSIKAARTVQAIERTRDLENLVAIAESWSSYYKSASGPIDRRAAGLDPVTSPTGQPVTTRMARVFHDVADAIVREIATDGYLAAHPNFARVVSAVPLVLSQSFGIIVDILKPKSTATDQQLAYLLNELIQQKIFEKFLTLDVGRAARTLLDKKVPDWQADIDKWYKTRERDFCLSLDNATYDWLVNRDARDIHIRTQIKGQRALILDSSYARAVSDQLRPGVDTLFEREELERYLDTRHESLSQINQAIRAAEHAFDYRQRQSLQNHINERVKFDMQEVRDEPLWRLP